MTHIPLSGRRRVKLSCVCKAATRYVRKRVESFSPSPSDNHAVGRWQPASHSLTNVVFPKPAGAEMRVRLRCRPSFSRSIRRGRLTKLGRSWGIYSFVARIGVTSSLLQFHSCWCPAWVMRYSPGIASPNKPFIQISRIWDI